MPAKELSAELEAVLSAYSMLVHLLKKMLNTDNVLWATTKIFAILVYYSSSSASCEATQAWSV